MKNRKYDSWGDLTFRYCIDIDYDNHNEGCDCSMICRCSRIENIQIKNVELNEIRNKIIDFYHNQKIKLSYFDIYCLDRLLVINEIYKGDSWYVNVRSGYYGEEIGDVDLIKEKQIREQFEKIISYNTTDKIHTILILEYGYVLEDLLDKRFEICEVSRDDVVLNQKQYYKKIAKTKLYSNYDLPKAICLFDGGKYRVIDGYHRIIDNEDENFEIIVGV